VHLARTIELQSVTLSYSKKAPRGATPGARSDPKHRQLARQVGGVSLIQASSMAITFQHKIALPLGSVFCFGTISSVVDEEGTLHRIADPLERKPSLIISGKVGTKQEKAQPPVLWTKTTSCKLGAENSFTRRTPLSTSSTEKWTRITRKKETNEMKARQAALLVPPPSKENRKKLVVTTTPFYPDVLFIGGEWNRPPSPAMSRPRPGKNLLSGKLVNEGTDAAMSGAIMKPENGTRRSLYHKMRSRRWEKLQMNESSGKGGTPTDVIVGKLKSRPSRRRDNVERTLSSDET
jgi:hypothetical protein